MNTADILNAHLADGGHVKVSTRLKSTIYGPRNAGAFSESAINGNLYVQRGPRRECLSFGDHLLVSIVMSVKAVK